MANKKPQPKPEASEKQEANDAAIKNLAKRLSKNTKDQDEKRKKGIEDVDGNWIVTA